MLCTITEVIACNIIHSISRAVWQHFSSNNKITIIIINNNNDNIKESRYLRQRMLPMAEVQFPLEVQQIISVEGNQLT